MSRAKPLHLLVGLLALLLATVVLAQGGPPIIEIDGKPYMLLNEEQAQRLADIMLKQRQIIDEQAKKLKQGGCA